MQASLSVCRTHIHDMRTERDFTEVAKPIAWLKDLPGELYISVIFGISLIFCFFHHPYPTPPLFQNHPTSPRSTPNSSPRSRSGLSPTFASAAMGAQPSLRSSGAVIPSLGPSPVVGVGAAGASSSTPGTPLETSLTGVGGDVRQAFQGPSLSAAHTRSLRNDLLVAADSVTNAMSSLVKELNSGKCTQTKTKIETLVYTVYLKDRSVLMRGSGNFHIQQICFILN